MIEEKSLDVFAEKLAKLRELFPEVLSEGKIDFKRLQSVLGEEVLFHKEHYELSWAGKSDARAQIQKATSATLIPTDTVGAADCHNIFIEGENLEVLHVLQRAYFGKIKMIYIDPPYNTGNDSFVYPDDYSERQDEYQKRAGITDENGFLNKQDCWKKNSKENGQFHSVWLSMMYPRLYLARNLLREDGVIFISIDDNEQANLKLLCDEIFGAENFVTTICIKMSHLSGVKMSHTEKKPPKIKEFLLLYAKNKEHFTLKPIYEKSDWDDALDRYNQFITNKDEPFEKWNVIPVRQAAFQMNIDVKNKAEYEEFLIDHASSIFRTARNKSLETSDIKNQFTKIISKRGLTKFVYNDEEVLFASEKMMEIDGQLVPANILGDIWLDIGINNLHNEGQVEFKNGKKPLKLLKRCMDLVSNENDIILDFFAGSGTTAHAVLDLNEQDGGNRQFICVQMPEVLDETSEAYKAGYRTIADICKTRITKVVG